MPICGTYTHNLTVSSDVQLLMDKIHPDAVGCLPTESWYFCGYLCLHKPSFLLELELKKITDSCSTYLYLNVEVMKYTLTCR